MPRPERQLIAAIRRVARSRSSAIVVGIGDDSAVLRIPAGHETLVTTDFSLEGVHFRREWHPPDSVGHRCLLRGLSDIAAMGGEPLAAFLSLALPHDAEDAWMNSFIKGLLKLATRYNVSLAGGDLAESPAGVMADIMVLGSVPRGRAILRSTAAVGDIVYVTGDLGGSAAVIESLYAGLQLDRARLDSQFFPLPQLAVGRYLRQRKLATSMIDISDGLSTDLSHVCEESRVGVILEEAAIPIARLERPRVELRHALHGGDDYQLLFTAKANQQLPKRIAGIRVTHIGTITRSRRMMIRDEAGKLRNLQPQGWQHFVE